MGVPTQFGRYLVLDTLGAGEMGSVYLAEDPRIGRKVAIKSIQIDPAHSASELEELRYRFEQEIQVAGTFSHPNIVTLYDVGQEGDYTFIAMEYVDGQSLDEEIHETGGALPFDRVIELIVPVCDALNYAHERRIVHRDVKPANVLLTSDGVPKITDFGLARLSGSTLTHAGTVFGTPAYMSPEQATGRGTDGASDQFSVSVMLYEMLAGQRPFAGESTTGVVYQIIHQDPVPPEVINPLLPVNIGPVLLRGLSKNPLKRYRSCNHLAEALCEALEVEAPRQPSAAAIKTAERPAVPTERPPAPDPLVTAVENTGALRPAAGSQPTPILPGGLERFAAPLQAAAERLLKRPVWLGLAATLAVVLLGSTWVWSYWSDEPTSRAVLGDRANLALTRLAEEQHPMAGGQQEPSTGDQPAVGALPIVDTAEGDSEDPATPSPDRSTTRDPSGAQGSGDTSGARGSSEPRRAETSGGRTVVDTPDDATGADRSATTDTATAGADSSEVGPTEDEPLPPGTLRMAEGLPFTVTTRPEQARVFLDGEQIAGVTPAEIVVDAAATHSLRIVANGHEPLEWEFSVDGLTQEQRETGVLHFPLRPLGSHASGSTSRAGNYEVVKVRAPDDVETPVLTHHVEPQVAGRDRKRGIVILEVQVGTSGSVVQAKILRGLSPKIDRAVLDAVLEWKYRPTRLDDRPVNVTHVVSVRFD